MAKQDYYKVLDVPRSATEADIKAPIAASP